MRARVSRRGAVLLMAVALAFVVVAVTGCGEDEKASTNSSAVATAADGRSADQIVKDSDAKMATVDSAAFTADFGLKVQGDASKMTDPTAKALLSQGVTFEATGRTANKPTATDMSMSVDIAGQTLEFGMKAIGDKAWLQYQGSWYKVDGKNAKALDQQAEVGAAPTEQLKSLGIDPSGWGAEYTLAGTETLDGVQVYHIKATADPQKLAESLTKAAQDTDLEQKLGGAGSELGQLSQGLTQDAKQAEDLAKSLTGATVDYWIGVDDAYMYKTQFAVTMDPSGQKDLQGVEGMSLNGAVSMSEFDQAFDVTAPAGAKPFDDFMNQLFGGLLGGSGALTF